MFLKDVLVAPARMHSVHILNSKFGRYLLDFKVFLTFKLEIITRYKVVVSSVG